MATTGRKGLTETRPGRAVLLTPPDLKHNPNKQQGMKPLFKWASSSPWTEMQLQALSAPDYATALQQIWKAVWGLVWFAVLARVLGYLMYRHYLLRSVPPALLPARGCLA